MNENHSETLQERALRIPADGAIVDGDLALPSDPRGIVLFAHGSGSSRHSRRNRYVAAELRKAGLATLLMDLLTPEEELEDRWTGHLRFDIPFLAERLTHATRFIRSLPETRALPCGYFGASTGAAAALVAAAENPDWVQVIVSRGGRPDLAGPALSRVRAPTLLIVGGDDMPVIPLNQQALEMLGADDVDLKIIPGATHLFEEPGALEEVARLASEWFASRLGKQSAARAA